MYQTTHFKSQTISSFSKRESIKVDDTKTPIVQKKPIGQ